MKNKHKVLIIDEDALLNALREYGKGANSKDYEYMASIYMKRKLEKDHNKPFCIVFDTKDSVTDSRKFFTPSPEETNDILRKMLQEDTPVDFGLVEGTVKEHAEVGFAFQVKKFIGLPIENYNQNLLDYIHKVLSKYKPGEVSLLVIPGLKGVAENSVQLDIEFLRKNIVVPSESFLGVFLLFNDGKPIIKQLWPPQSKHY